MVSVLEVGNARKQRKSCEETGNQTYELQTYKALAINPSQQIHTRVLKFTINYNEHDPLLVFLYNIDSLLNRFAATEPESCSWVCQVWLWLIVCPLLEGGRGTIGKKIVFICYLLIQFWHCNRNYFLFSNILIYF